MKEWVSVEEYSLLTGKNKNNIYSMKKNDSLENKEKKYKKINGKLFINTNHLVEIKQVQKEFEALYYDLIEVYENEHALSVALSKIMRKPKNGINMYFRDCFITKRSSEKINYVKAMRILKESL